MFVHWEIFPHRIIRVDHLSERCTVDAALRTDKSTKIGKIIDFKVKDKETKFGATRAEFWVAQGVFTSSVSNL